MTADLEIAPVPQDQQSAYVRIIPTGPPYGRAFWCRRAVGPNRVSSRKYVRDQPMAPP